MQFIVGFLLIWLWLNIMMAVCFPATRHMQTDWAQYSEEGSQGPGSYTFGYDVEATRSNNIQFKHESRFKNGTVSGSYGLLEPDGNVRIVHYVADEMGYRVHIENTKRKSELYPQNILNINMVHKDKEKKQLVEATKSPYLESAEQMLPFLGLNYVHENHERPAVNRLNLK